MGEEGEGGVSGWTESEQSGQRATGGLGRGFGQSEPCRCRSLQPQNLQRVSVKPAEISSLSFFPLFCPLCLRVLVSTDVFDDF